MRNAIYEENKRKPQNFTEKLKLDSPPTSYQISVLFYVPHQLPGWCGTAQFLAHLTLGESRKSITRASRTLLRDKRDKWVAPHWVIRAGH